MSGVRQVLEARGLWVPEAHHLKASLGETPLTGVSTDTRTLKRGNLFVPLPGRHYNAHAFIPEAIKRGAAGYLYHAHQRPQISAAQDIPNIGVRDTLAAYQSLAAAYRQQVLGSARIIALSGSCGKTTLKEYLRLWLSHWGSVHATTANENNEIGVALTLLSAPHWSDYVVVEMGMRLVHDLAELTPWVAPDICLLSCVQETHLSEVRSLDEVYQGKLALFRHAPQARWVGTADDERILTHLSKNPRSISFGASEKAQIRWTAQQMLPDGSVQVDLTAAADVGWELGSSARLRVSGPCHELKAEHVSACVAVCTALGLGLHHLKTSLLPAPILAGRFAVSHHGSYHVVDDSYNAAPASMRAGLKSFHNLSQKSEKVVIILGDMLELGAEEAQYHHRLGEYLGELYADMHGAHLKLALIGALSTTALLKGWRSSAAKNSAAVELQKFNTTESCQKSRWWQEMLQSLSRLPSARWKQSQEWWFYLKASHSIGLGRLALELREATGGGRDL